MPLWYEVDRRTGPRRPKPPHTRAAAALAWRGPSPPAVQDELIAGFQNKLAKVVASCVAVLFEAVQ